MNRIFISYRSSDGKKDANRLAADLNRIFGDEQVFFDKHDLQGGSSWRSRIDGTLGQRPVVLLLMTPDLFGALHPDGGRRIDRDDDPIRGELRAAYGNGALIVPLLVEGMLMPATSALPADLHFIGETHALKLRTDDWPQDLRKLVADLEAQGIEPAAEIDRPNRQRRPIAVWVALAAGVVGGLAALGYFGAWFGSPPPRTDSIALPAAQPSPSTGKSASSTLDGPWWSVDGQGRRTPVRVDVQAGSVELLTDRIPVSWVPAWQAYAHRMQQDNGIVIRDLVYRGKGSLTPQGLDLAVEVFSGDGHGPLDTGNLRLVPSADGQQLIGALWSNGDQAESPFRLERGR